MKHSLCLVLFFSILIMSSPVLLAENLVGKYELESSTIDYLVTYLIKKADGSSSQAKGKGECLTTGCEFLVAAPIKSFVSKDSNRDLNMVNVTKAERFPLVVAKIKTSPAFVANLKADVEVEFSGVKYLYKDIIFKTSGSEKKFHAVGSFVLILENHKIERPSLLGVDINNEVPIKISADWKKI